MVTTKIGNIMVEEDNMVEEDIMMEEDIMVVEDTMVIIGVTMEDPILVSDPQDLDRNDINNHFLTLIGPSESLWII